MEKESIQVQELTSRIKEAVSNELTTRDELLAGKVNLKARQAQLREKIDALPAERSKILANKIEIVKAGGDVADSDAKVNRLHEAETASRQELSAIEIVNPADDGKLRQAEARLQRATLAAIKAERPDCEIDALFAAAMDAVEAWRVEYRALLQDLKISPSVAYDGEWWYALDPHLSNPVIKRLNAFVPKHSLPEQPPRQPVKVNKVPVQPEPEQPKGMTDAEAQENARKDGRMKNHLRANQQQTVTDPNYDITGP